MGEEWILPNHGQTRSDPEDSRLTRQDSEIGQTTGGVVKTTSNLQSIPHLLNWPIASVARAATAFER
jgi:hypothetical protein